MVLGFGESNEIKAIKRAIQDKRGEENELRKKLKIQQEKEKIAKSESKIKKMESPRKNTNPVKKELSNLFGDKK